MAQKYNYRTTAQFLKLKWLLYRFVEVQPSARLTTTWLQERTHSICEKKGESPVVYTGIWSTDFKEEGGFTQVSDLSYVLRVIKNKMSQIKIDMELLPICIAED